MLEFVLQECVEFLLYAILAIFAQNAVFSRGFGVSRLVQLVGDDALNSKVFATQLFVVQLCTAPIAYYANRILVQVNHRALVRPLTYLLCVFLVCGLLYLIFATFGKEPNRLWIEILPIAALNSCVLGTLLIATKQEYNLMESVGFGLGSGIGYVMAVGIVTEAQRKLRAPTVPDAFKGLPITLIYIGILSLAIYAFTGHTVTI